VKVTEKSQAGPRVMQDGGRCWWWQYVFTARRQNQVIVVLCHGLHVMCDMSLIGFTLLYVDNADVHAVK
jgi:hypothetical protein